MYLTENNAVQIDGTFSFEQAYDLPPLINHRLKYEREI